MSRIKVVVVAAEMITPYGRGTDLCWEGLVSAKTAISKLERFSTKSFQSENAAVIPGLKADSNESLVMQMLKALFNKQPFVISADALLILATTTGEIDILEEHILYRNRNAADSRLDYLLEKIIDLSGVDGAGMVISAACSSSSMAVAQAAGMISSDRRDCVLVVTCDSVSEFVFSGFSALGALDKDKARPFDKNRNGLSLGEAVGSVLLMSESRAVNERRPILAEVAGWGASSDANHMTGPSRDGDGLRLAINKTLASAGITPEAVGCISAHGTGTRYNDSMEMKAFKSVFGKRVVPVYSIKGGTGHTLGSAGLIEMIIAVKSLKEKVVPPTVNLHEVDSEARGWISVEPRSLDSPITLSVNSGFGGINVSLALKATESYG